MRGAPAALLLALIVGLVPRPAVAIEELEAEENIAELLPNRFPAGQRPRTLAFRPWAVLPQVGYGPDTGIVLGAKFAHRDAFDAGVSLDIDGAYATEEQRSAAFSIASPHLAGDRLILLLRARYLYDPRREFFGLGNNEVGPAPASTHEFGEAGGALTIGWRPFERLAFNIAVGLRDVVVCRGQRRAGTPFTVDAYPDLPGIRGGTVNPLALSLVWNTRDDVLRPTRGWRLILKAIHTNRAFLSDYDYTRYLMDAGYLRSFADGRRIAGVRLNGEWIDGPSGQIPFWELAELGGQDTLRGFFPHRFVGKGRLLLNGEFRSRIADFDFYELWHVKLDGVLFADGGRVFIDRAELQDEFHLDSSILDRVLEDFQYSYGGGFRLVLSDAIVARIDAGFSNEETGLVYLSFGHTF